MRLPHRIVKLSRGEHPQADVCNEVERPADAQKQQVVIGQLITAVAVQQVADHRPTVQVIVRASLAKQRVAEGKLLENALEACARWGLHFDAVNDSLPSWKKFYGDDTRKVGATEYWDDKAYRVQNGKLMKEAAHEMV